MEKSAQIRPIRVIRVLFFLLRTRPRKYPSAEGGDIDSLWIIGIHRHSMDTPEGHSVQLLPGFAAVVRVPESVSGSPQIDGIRRVWRNSDKHPLAGVGFRARFPIQIALAEHLSPGNTAILSFPEAAFVWVFVIATGGEICDVRVAAVEIESSRPVKRLGCGYILPTLAVIQGAEKPSSFPVS